MLERLKMTNEAITQYEQFAGFFLSTVEEASIQFGSTLLH
jgi:hypothetical protein